jgi:hypothetical protein
MTSPALLLLLLLALPPGAQQWTPPEKPDPTQILREAYKDASAGRHELALAKHLWYHENALKYAKGQSGVRRSFALSSWLQLAQSHPPAMAALKAARDAAQRNVLAGAPGFDAFADFAALNRTLGEERLTRDVFVQLDRDGSRLAATAFYTAQPALIKHEEYELCLKYIRPKEAFARAVTIHQMHQKQLAEKRSEPLANFAEKKFTNTVATIVGLLAVNGRSEEAAQIAGDAKKEWKDAAFHAAIDDALKGNVPKPFP